MIRVADTLQTVTSSDAVALQEIKKAQAENEVLLARIEAAKAELEADAARLNEDLEARRKQVQEELQAIREADLATIEANAKQAIEDAKAARELVEQARGKLAEDVLAMKGKASTAHEALKAQMIAIADAIHAGATADKAWAAPIIRQGKESIIKQLDEAVASLDALRGWVEPRPVDEAKIAEVIARDLKTLAIKKEAEQ